VHGLLSTFFTKAATAGLAGKVAAGAVAVAVIGGGTAAAAATVLQPTSDSSAVVESGTGDTTPVDATSSGTSADPADPGTATGDAGDTADQSGADVPGADVPGADVPGADVPGADVPAAEVPAEDTEEPATHDQTDGEEPADPADPAPAPSPAPAPAPAPVNEVPQTGGAQDNHGAAVSSVAHQSFESGRAHGKAVSEAARNKTAPVAPAPVAPAPVAPAPEVEAPEAPEAPASEVEAPEAATPDSGTLQVSSDSSTGKGNGNGSGNGNAPAATPAPAAPGNSANAPGQQKQAPAPAAQAPAPKSTPPGQAKKASSPAPVKATNAPGVKPSNTTGAKYGKPSHYTIGQSGPDTSKRYGNGKTAAQIAKSRGAPDGTLLTGPGNSQPHKVTVCGKPNNRSGGVDVHAVKSYSTAACTQTQQAATPATAVPAAPVVAPCGFTAVTTTQLLGMQHYDGKGRPVKVMTNPHSAHFKPMHGDTPVTSTTTTLVPNGETCATESTQSTLAAGTAGTSQTSSGTGSNAGALPANQGAVVAASVPHGGVAGVQATLVSPKKAHRAGGVLGALATIGTVAHGRLPFTGLPLWGAVLLALVLIGAGIALYRRTRTRTPAL
jgi:hypothetical protein